MLSGNDLMIINQSEAHCLSSKQSVCKLMEKGE